MSPQEFIKKGYGKDQLEKAARQQNQLQYLTVSEIQESISEDYVEKLASSNYTGDDPLLEWVYALFKKDNFKSFYKYLRFPLASSRLCQDEIEKSMERVFFSDDSFKKYVVNGEEIQAPEFLREDDFLKEVFYDSIYRFNDVIIHDLEDINEPYRKLICIDDVVSVKTKHNKIKKIAYRCTWDYKGQDVDGHVFLDDELMAFYPNDKYNLEPLIVEHDIDRCPATFVGARPFNQNEPIVRQSIFSRVRSLLEEYVFLNTLRLMSDANGAFPIVVKLAAQSVDEEDNVNTEFDQEPMSSSSYSGHKQKPAESDLQAGSVHEVPLIEKQDGSIDTTVVEKYINFFRTPVDSLKYIDERIKATEKEIIKTVVGDYTEANEGAKNEMQVSKSYIAKQDRLRSFGTQMSYAVKESDDIMLKLAYGEDVSVDFSMGTDFFIETQEDLFNLFKNAPNPVEKNHILYRLARVRGKTNEPRMNRDMLL